MAPASQRVLSVDVLRGLTIALMILVNDPGDWAHVYPQLDHAEWSGWTLTDLVFPTFLFLIGLSLILSLQSRINRGESRARLAGHIVRRSATIFALQIFLGLYPHLHYTHLRLFGVLARIALCYLAAGMICLLTQRPRNLLAIVATLLLGYWALMRFVPVPGFGVPNHDIPLLDHDGNLTAYIDRAFNAFTHRYLHTGHLYRRTNDPEGLLSTLPAIATTLLGALTALFLRSTATAPTTKRNTFALTGAGLVLTGELWNRTFPFNKNLWTSSYVLLAAGIALLALALLYWLVDVEQFQARSRLARAALWPWLVFGSNAIVAFFVSDFLVETLAWIKLPSGDPAKALTAWAWLYQHGFAHGHSTERTSAAFALAYVAVCFLPNWLLWRKKIFVKI